MGQQLETWQGGDSDRRWLSLLIDAMERAARPEIRSQPIESAILAALHAQLAGSATHYGRVPSLARH